MSVKRIARDAVLTALALVIFAVELQIPPLTPVPGIKLGLANVVTVAALFLFGPWDAGAIMILRILLGGFFSSNPSAIIYSLAGGAFSFAALLLMRKIVNKKQIWAASTISAAFHYLGQICAAVLITRTPALFAYLPVLTAAGIIAGIVTGLAAQLAVNRIKKLP